MFQSINDSLQKKFILITFISVLILAVLVSVFVASKTRSALYNATEQKGRMLAQTVSALIINELIYEQLGLVEEGGLIDNYVRELYERKELELLYVAVLNPEFQVISHSDFGEFGKDYQDPFVQETQQAQKVLVKKTQVQDSTVNALEFATSLSIEGKRWGVLLFSISLESVEKEAKKILFQILLLTSMALILLFLLVFFLSQRFIRPIIDLSQAMAEVEIGMVEKAIPVKGRDELSQLAESYNEMVRRIRDTNEEMKLAHEKLLQSEKLATLGVLSSSVAHRINNPLGGLFNCVQMLKRKGDDPEFRANYLALVEEGLDNIEETVGQLLWTAGTREGEERACEISTALSGVVKFLDYRMGRQNISYSESVTPGLRVSVPPHDLEEIFLNTMINSIQAMENGGQLIVSAGREGRNTVICIEDNGIGIAKDKLDKVFELFYSTKKAGEGTGLGMWMTYELVVKYKGTIKLQSTEGVGTSVIISIPESK
ncbi:ATP-binding protein [Desulforhopalus sp. IMCC35007]|uniref:sensor histidine kinase n=1 Tax=Desulforhopalus sp. IMCC35007 TaxID=2569543 RepID=UPI0010AE6EAB|nr:ATP-binding protein [Desulforhopalus sp. IMCC35007]TKB10424.1 HAMP domain-containing protein [Desulforhopalus sp. IMCC35007]